MGLISLAGLLLEIADQVVRGAEGIVAVRGVFVEIVAAIVGRQVIMITAARFVDLREPDTFNQGRSRCRRESLRALHLPPRRVRAKCCRWEERRGGKECVSTCRSRGWLNH